VLPIHQAVLHLLILQIQFKPLTETTVCVQKPTPLR